MSYWERAKECPVPLLSLLGVCVRVRVGMLSVGGNYVFWW